MAVPFSLKALPHFDGLTAAESLIFEGELGERKYRSGDAVASLEAILVVREGRLHVEVETADGPLPFATVEAGGILGEMAFFEPAPVKVGARAETDAVCFSVDRPSLKNSFRYSRTGAVKFMACFARSLSRKIRSANRLLEKPLSSALQSADEFRPSQLDSVDLQRLMTLSITRRYGAGDTLFREGDVGRELFVISEGEVEITKGGSSNETMTLARLGPGDFFGEMAFVDEEPRSAGAIARSPLRVHVLPAGSLEKAAEYNVGMALYLTSVICKIMARRLNVTLKRLGAR